MKNIILVGYRGTGKTTVACQLAERLGWPAVDADNEIEKLAGKSIKDIFAADGETAFRDYEATVVARMCEGREQVLAMGGGAILRAGNRSLMRENGVVFWLTADAETLYARISGDPMTSARRPNLTVAGGIEEIRNLLQQRQAAYQAAAHHCVDTAENSPVTVAEMIHELISRQDSKS